MGRDGEGDGERWGEMGRDGEISPRCGEASPCAGLVVGQGPGHRPTAPRLKTTRPTALKRRGPVLGGWGVLGGWARLSAANGGARPAARRQLHGAAPREGRLFTALASWPPAFSFLGAAPREKGRRRSGGAALRRRAGGRLQHDPHPSRRAEVGRVDAGEVADGGVDPRVEGAVEAVPRNGEGEEEEEGGVNA